MRIIIFVVCVMLSMQSLVFAEVFKSKGEDSLSLTSYVIYPIKELEEDVHINIGRIGYFKSFLGVYRTDTNHNMMINIYPQKPNQAMQKTFTTKATPYFTLINKGVSTDHKLHKSSIGMNYVSFDVENKDLLPMVNAEAVNLIIPLNDGTVKTLAINQDTINEWKYILTCSMYDEYKKGF